MNHVQRKIQCPAGFEEINSQAALGARLACSGQHAGRLTISGAIKPAHHAPFQRFYKTADLDALRYNAIQSLKAKCRLLSGNELKSLAAGLPAPSTPPTPTQGRNRAMLKGERHRMTLCGGKLFLSENNKH